MWVTPRLNSGRRQIYPSTDPGSVGISAAESKSGRSSPEAHIIRAPRAGRILRILTYPGEISDGILQMGDRQMYVVAEVYETDVGLVKGQPATITSRNGAFNTPLNGKVAEMADFKNNVLDDDPAANADARVVVKIRLDDSQRVEALPTCGIKVK